MYKDRLVKKEQVSLHYGNLSNPSFQIKMLGETQPNEICNLAAQIHV